MDSILTPWAPLLLASLGALVSDFSGALGIFIEGFMVLGAFFSWIFASRTGSVALGTALGALLLGGAGYALAVFVRVSRANPFIAGLALNIAAEGLVETLSALWFGTKGALRDSALGVPPAIHIPLIEDIPLLGAFSGQSPFVYLALGLTVLAAGVLGRTVVGLRLRAAGGSFEAASERGIRPERWRESAWGGAAFLAALAGGAVTFRVGAYIPGGIAGRGWIALAAVYLGSPRGRVSGGGRVWGCALASLFFTAAERAGMAIQRFGALPPTALLGLPALLAVVLYGLSMKMRKEGG